MSNIELPLIMFAFLLPAILYFKTMTDDLLKAQAQHRSEIKEKIVLFLDGGIDAVDRERMILILTGIQDEKLNQTDYDYVKSFKKLELI